MKDQEHLHELAMRYLDGRLNDAETEELNGCLRADAEARAWLWEIAAQATEMGDIARTQTALQPNVVPSLKSAWWPPAFFPWKAAILLLAAATLFFWPRGQTQPTIVTLTEAAGEVTWSSGGQILAGLAVGQRLPAGTVTVESETGSAELCFADGTRLMLNGRSEAAVAADPPKRVHLKEGTLFADVALQPPGYPMLLRTPTADIQVLGTAFALTVGADRTVLNVERGRVTLRRLVDGQAVEVDASQTASASLDTAERLKASPQQSPPIDWRLDLSVPAGQKWKCQWRSADAKIPARALAVPYQANNAQNPARIFYGVVVGGRGGDSQPLATLTSGSVLLLRCRTQTPARLEAFLSTHRPGGQFGGNFIVPIPMKTAVREPGGWMNIEVPLAQNRPLFPHLGTALDGLQVFLLIINSTDQDAGLEIAELSIGHGATQP